MTVSIIVAVKGDNPYLRECLEACRELDYPDFEILVLPDEAITLDYPKTKVIPTAEVTPPIKRDIALLSARGEILAFLDDDAYPAKGWLTKALSYFSDSRTAAVGGPAVTPESDDIWQKASGRVYGSWAMSGVHRYRYIPGKKREVDDYPSCNFLVRRSVMREIGGFDAKFWPGEDTFFCLKIVRDLKQKIIYAPEVLVYHHRRRLFKGHLKQIANYGLHRGYFAKRFPETSLKLAYFLPSLLVAALSAAPIVFLFSGRISAAYFLAVFLYLVAIFISSISRGFALTALVFWGIILSHIVYGVYFIKGILSGKLKEE